MPPCCEDSLFYSLKLSVEGVGFWWGEQFDSIMTVCNEHICYLPSLFFFFCYSPWNWTSWSSKNFLNCLYWFIYFHGLDSHKLKCKLRYKYKWKWGTKNICGKPRGNQIKNERVLNEYGLSKKLQQINTKEIHQDCFIIQRINEDQIAKQT